MRGRIVASALTLVLSAGLAFGADLDKAEKLLKIGDYAAALAELNELAKTDPTNIAVRLATARAYAECAYELQMPGDVTVGRSNSERAMYQLGILAKLDKPGQKALIGLIESGDAKLAPLALNVAGREKLTDAVDTISELFAKDRLDRGFTLAALGALQQIGGDKAAAAVAKLLDRDNLDAESTRGAVYTLSMIRGDRAAAAIKTRLDAEQNVNQKRWLADCYLNCLDDKTILELARKTTDPAILDWLTRQKPTEDICQVLVGRTDLDDAVRTQALNRLALTAAKDAPAYAKFLEGLLEDKSDELRWRATEHLARTEPERAIKPLVAALADEKRWRYAVARFYEIKSKAAVEPLMKVLEDKFDAKNFAKWAASGNDVWRAITASGAEGDTLLKAVRLMMQEDPAAQRTYRPPGQKKQMNLPWGIPAKELPAIVRTLLADKDADVRFAAARAVGSLQPKESVECALAALADKDDDVRHAAERTVIQHARTGLVEPEQLALLLKSDDSWVLTNDISLILAKPDQAGFALEPMLALLADKERSKSAMRQLIEYFTVVSDERAAAPLLAAVTAERPDAPVESVVQALKKCTKDTAAAAKEIAKGLKNESSVVRRNAAVALKELGDKSVLADLVEAARKAQPGFERTAFDDAIRALTAGK